MVRCKVVPNPVNLLVFKCIYILKGKIETSIPFVGQHNIPVQLISKVYRTSWIIWKELLELSSRDTTIQVAFRQALHYDVFNCRSTSHPGHIEQTRIDPVRDKTPKRANRTADWRTSYWSYLKSL